MTVATGKKIYLDTAVTAARWIMVHRALLDGGFSHDQKDPAGPYLEDTLFMGQAFLDLYTATGDRQWLALSEKAASRVRPDRTPPVGSGMSYGMLSMVG